MQKKIKTRMLFPSKKKLAKLFDDSDDIPFLGRKMSTDDVLKSNGVDPKKPDTYKEALFELIAARLLFDEGFKGFEHGALKAARTLYEYGIDPSSKIGQDLMKTYAENAVDEEYGDYDRSVDCLECGAAFEPDFSLAYTNRVLAYDGAICDKCWLKMAK